MPQKVNIRTLRADEILVNVERVREIPGSKGTYSGELVLYKDARCDMRILDETFGMRWKRSHKEVNGVLYCTISVWDEEIGQWIEREDAGRGQNFESEKSAASDSFKRAGFNFGIGRELYTTPEDARVTLREDEVELGRDGKLYAKRDVIFYVNIIEYDKDRKISSLIVNGPDNRPRYAFPEVLANELNRKQTTEAPTGPVKADETRTRTPGPERTQKPTNAPVNVASVPAPPVVYPAVPTPPTRIS